MRIDATTTAVVTGAAGGLGRAVALDLAWRGCRLALVDVDAAGLDDTRAALGAIPNPPDPVSLHAVDLADRARVEDLRSAVVARHGGVDVLINAAGVSVAAPFERVDLEDFEWLMGTNFWGTVYTCHAFLPVLRGARQARICNVLSQLALIGIPTKTCYCASKFALRGFGEALAAELRDTNVGVTDVYLGAIRTRLIENGRSWDPDKQADEARFVAERGMSADVAARRIRRAIERDRPRVRIGASTLLIDLFARGFPSLKAGLVAWFANRFPFLRP